MPIPTLPNPGIITGASNITQGCDSENVTIYSLTPISFEAIMDNDMQNIVSIVISEGIFSKANGETFTLKGTLTFTNPCPVNISIPSYDLNILKGGVLIQALGSNDLASTNLGNALVVENGIVVINTLNNCDISCTGTITNIILNVITQQKNNSISSFCGATYVDNMNASKITIPTFNNNALCIGDIAIIQSITSSVDLPQFYTTEGAIVAVTNTSMTNPIKITTFNSATTDDNDFYTSETDSIEIGETSIYLQLATGVFTQLFIKKHK